MFPEQKLKYHTIRKYDEMQILQVKNKKRTAQSIFQLYAVRRKEVEYELNFYFGNLIVFISRKNFFEIEEN